MMAIGALRDRVHLQARGMTSDGISGQLVAGAFATRHTVWANLRPLRGTESVMASRLEGRQPYILTIRQSSATRQVDETWQVVDARNQDRVFAVVAPPTDPDGRRVYFEILIVEGGRS